MGGGGICVPRAVYGIPPFRQIVEPVTFKLQTIWGSVVKYLLVKAYINKERSAQVAERNLQRQVVFS